MALRARRVPYAVPDSPRHTPYIGYAVVTASHHSINVTLYVERATV